MGLLATFTAIPDTLPPTLFTAPLAAQLPLRNVTWKPPNRPLRTIDTVKVDFVPLEQARKDKRCYAHVLFVAGDDSDYYRLSLRAQIREWLDSVTTPTAGGGSSTEWMIVHLVLPSSVLGVNGVGTGAGGSGGSSPGPGATSASSSSSSNKFYQRNKGSVFDKIRADFNTGKRDRCVSVALPTVTPAAGAPVAPWPEFLASLKSALLSSFDAHLAALEEAVRKSDSGRASEAWNFLKFFEIKEQLAEVYEALGLSDEALVRYEELEASFFFALRDGKTACFGGGSGSLAPGSDALPLLPTPEQQKPYRLRIKDGSVSVLDFRVYLFAKQAGLLLGTGRVEEMARRAMVFVSSLGRTLRDAEGGGSLAANFLESWTYSACLNVLERCQLALSAPAGGSISLSNGSSGLPGSGAATPTGPAAKKLNPGFLGVKAELLELARKQLDKVGISVGHLPDEHPFAMSLPPAKTPRIEQVLSDSPSPSPGSSRAPTPTAPPLPPEKRSSGVVVVTRPDLLEALKSREKFDQLYVELTNRGIRACRECGRSRKALGMHVLLASLEELRNRPQSAQKLFANLPEHYIDTRWLYLESILLARCVRLQSALGLKREQLLSELALVRAGMKEKAGSWHLGKEVLEVLDGDKASAKTMMGEIHALSLGLDKDFAAIAFPTFEMKLGGRRGRVAGTEDGAYVDLVVKNFLPEGVDVEEIRLKFQNTDGDQIWFTTGKSRLAPGATTVSLFCPTSINGRLYLELSQIRFSRIIFQYSHRTGGPANSGPVGPNPSFADLQRAVYFPRDRQALDTYIELPSTMYLDSDREVIICVSTGRNDVARAHLRISGISEEELALYLDRTKVEGMDEAKLQVTADGLHLENVPSGATVKLRVPFVSSVVEAFVQMTISVEYFTVARPTTRRLLRRLARLPLALPLAVQVQDYFREDHILSRFTVTTDGYHGLHIHSAALESDAEDLVDSCRYRRRHLQVVLPSQSAQFLFKLRRDALKDETESLRFILKYTPVYEVFETGIKACVTNFFASRPGHAFDDDFVEQIAIRITGEVDEEHFSKTGRLDTLELDRSIWSLLLRHTLDRASVPDVLATLEELYMVVKKSDFSQPVSSSHRTLVIPVDASSFTSMSAPMPTAPPDLHGLAEELEIVMTERRGSLTTAGRFQFELA